MTNIEGMDIAEITLVKNSFSLYASIKSSRNFVTQTSDQRTVLGQILQQTSDWISTPWTTVSVVPAQPQVVI